MKSLQFLACSIAFLIPCAAPVSAAPFNTTPATPPQPLNKPSPEMQQLLTEGQTAYLKGDMATAKADLQLVLELDPHNKTATGYLRMIAVKEAQDKRSGGGVVEKQLQALTIPKLEFKEATFGSALDYMKRTADRLSGGKVVASFVVAPEIPTTTPVTLSLANIPFTEALRYLGDVAGVRFTYDKYAIRVTPKNPIPNAPATVGANVPSAEPPK